VAGLEAIVVVPARDEEARIAFCLRALAEQSVGIDAFEVIVVLDACADETGSVAARAAAEHGLSLTLIEGPGGGSGPARRAGMELACERLLSWRRPDGLIATTDADSRPHVDWLARQLAHRDLGAQVIAGRIELDASEARDLPEAVVRRREREAAARLRLVRLADPDAAHHHFAGASLAVTASTYRAVGGIEPTEALEDERFAQRLAQHRIRVLRAPDVIVTTSARLGGRVARGLSIDLALARWMTRRRYRADEFLADELSARRDPASSVTVIVPARECAETIAGVLEVTVAPSVRAGLVDEVVVVDAASRDGTAAVAGASGARVIQQDDIASELGPALGKGDAMWRALQATGGDIVCFLDGDTRDPDPAHLRGILGPLLSDPGIAFVKGAFERPFDAGGTPLEHEGGRVTEIMARPLLNLHAPLLAGFAQPLAGEFAARRDLLENMHFPAGYGVEAATLLDALALRGLDALAECHLGTRQNHHQPLRTLGQMAYAVLCAIEQRLPGGPRSAAAGRYVKPWEDGLVASVPIIERPPVREWTARLDGRESRSRDVARTDDER
jgi:glycosyltransferase involved in cell wall biosynthesis